MSRLSKEQVDLIAHQVLHVFRGGSKPDASKAVPVHQGPGIFADVSSAVDAAEAAQCQLMQMPLGKRVEIVASIRRSMETQAEDLARMAHAETGLGRVDDKILKNLLVTRKTPGVEVLHPTAYTGDRGLTLMELAPYGVIGAITPVTNPTSTIICNTLGMVAAGNAVVFNVHPSAKNVSIKNIALINQAICDVGGPVNLVTSVAEPTVASAQEVMKHPKIRLLVVTGGAAVVRAAMTSGKRAICAGPGNPPVVVDESADLDQAGRDIVFGASMDNNIICVDEKEVFAVSSIADRLIASMCAHDGVLIPQERLPQLERAVFTSQNGPGKAGVVDKDLIGKNAAEILQRIGMPADATVRLAVVEVPFDHPLVWTEQMMPVMPVVRVKNADEGIDKAKQAEQGHRHTATMHSKNLDHLSRMAREMDCSIFVKNGPSVAGLGHGGEGYASFSIASPTGEGLTHPRSFSRERRCVLVDHFRIV